MSTGEYAISALIVEALKSVSIRDNAINARIVLAVSMRDYAVNALIVEALKSVST